MQTTNDTEHLVHYLSTEGIRAIEKHLTGYYAFASVDPDGKLHVCRDDNATLYIAWVKSVESYIIATTESLITELCKSMRWKVGPVDAVQDNVYMVFNGNALIEHQEIKPRGYERAEASLMEKSLHYLDSSSRSRGSRIETTIDTLAASFDSSDYAQRYNSDYDSDLEKFLEECEEMDTSYTIVDRNGQRLELYEFSKLDDVSKAECVITRPDGTVLSVYDYETPRLANY